MAKKLEGKEMVYLEELAMSNAFQMEAIINILERKGLLSKEELLDEIKRLHQQR